nr:MAG TPA: hypothetical protein [Caudoviricetes sp.]
MKNHSIKIKRTFYRKVLTNNCKCNILRLDEDLTKE